MRGLLLRGYLYGHTLGAWWIWVVRHFMLRNDHLDEQIERAYIILITIILCFVSSFFLLSHHPSIYKPKPESINNAANATNLHHHYLSKIVTQECYLKQSTIVWLMFEYLTDLWSFSLFWICQAWRWLRHFLTGFQLETFCRIATFFSLMFVYSAI